MAIAYPLPIYGNFIAISLQFHCHVPRCLVQPNCKGIEKKFIVIYSQRKEIAELLKS